MKIGNDKQNVICLGLSLAIIIGMLVAVPDLPLQIIDLYHTVLGPPVPRMQQESSSRFDDAFNCNKECYK